MRVGRNVTGSQRIFRKERLTSRNSLNLMSWYSIKIEIIYLAHCDQKAHLAIIIEVVVVSRLTVRAKSTWAVQHVYTTRGHGGIR